MHCRAVDKGTFSGREILACHAADIVTAVPRPETPGNRKKGMYVKADFGCDAARDIYRCPAGEDLSLHDGGGRPSAASPLDERVPGLPAQEPLHYRQGTPDRPAREHEHPVEAMQDRIRGGGGWMRPGRATVEPPFGTIKAWMGATRFQMRRLKTVRTGMALQVLAYTVKRMLSMMGTRGLMAALSG